MAHKTLAAGCGQTKIQFSVAKSALGFVLVGATEKGVCSVLIGRDKGELTADLNRRFPKAVIARGGKTFEAKMNRVVRFIEKPLARYDGPLDIHGTAFQHKVWTALRAIPAGTTLSYTDIAKKIGKPKSYRAVAQACGANPVAVIVPCHRVVRSDGGLSGYRWGIERKRALLTLEKDAAPLGTSSRQTHLGNLKRKPTNFA